MGIDRARKLAWWDVQHTDQNQKLDASADPLHSHWIHKFDLGTQFRLFHGRIVDQIAYANCYKVQAQGMTSLWCTTVSMTALQPMGVRQVGQIGIGAGVIFALHNTDNYGIILGVIPDPQTAGKNAMGDFISQEGRAGILVDEAHNYPVSQPRASLIGDFSAGRPLDSLQNEWGHVTETGLLAFIDSFMSINRVDEETGVWHFWHDQYTRLAGHNLHIFSAGYEREDLDDEGEFNKIEGHAPYYWEALGAFEFETNISRDIPTACWQKDPALQGYSAVEPCNDHQVAFYRLRDFYGYLGQAHKRLLVLPPVCDTDPPVYDEAESTTSSCELPSCTPSGLNLLTAEDIYPGVFEEDLTLTGRYAVRSAHEIIFSKHIAIPAPKQVLRVEDPNGDTTSNYRAAGMQGSGPQHLIAGEIAIPEGPQAAEASQIRAAGFLDTHMFVFEWAGNHPFHYHERDWYIPNEADLEYLNECSQPMFDIPAFSELACYHLLETPPAIPLHVDHRYGAVNYYPNHSYIALLADGGVVIGDGFGTEFKLANGSFWLTCPGDAVIAAGRDVINLAGYDLIMRAKNSFDITASNHDGRIVANRNLCLSAVGTTGGIVIESFATTAGLADGTGEDMMVGGIVMKAPDSMISFCAPAIENRLTGSQEKVYVIDTGPEGYIKFRSKYFERFMGPGGGALDFWIDGDNAVQSGNEVWEDGSIFNSPIVAIDNILGANCLMVRGDITSVAGHMASAQKQYHGKLGLIGAQGAQDAEDIFITYEARAETFIGYGSEQLEKLNERIDDYHLCDAEFTFRTPDQYRTNDFVMYEARWQQLARLAGAQLSTWEELEVAETMPYPGREKFTEQTYRELDLKLYDSSLGLATDRGSQDYTEPEFAVPVSKSLADGYKVII